MAIETLSKATKAAFSVGHMLNDLCGAMWLTYFLIFFHQVLGVDAKTAGYLLLVGQITDGLATPLVGIESDRLGLCRNKYGRRKSWHLMGTACVALSFVFIYTPLPGYIPGLTPLYVTVIYYVPFIVIFHIGWAATQVAHLSIIPDLTYKDTERTQLNSFRYACTVLSSVLVYSIAIPLLAGSSSTELGWGDRTVFTHLAVIVVAIGLGFALIFHLVVPESIIEYDEDDLTPLVDDEGAEDELREVNIWYEWLKMPNFYLTGFIYMFTRVVVNMTQVYMPFYLTDVLKENKSMIAIGPLIVFLSAFSASLVIPHVSRLLRHSFVYLIGVSFILSGSMWAYFLAEPVIRSDGSLSGPDRYQIIGVTMCYGFGCASMLVSCLSLTTGMIGRNTTTSAFVYGAMTLTDKVANGIAVSLVQSFDPCATSSSACSYFFRGVMSFGIGGLALLAALLIVVHFCCFARHYVRDSVQNCPMSSDHSNPAQDSRQSVEQFNN